MLVGDSAVRAGCPGDVDGTGTFELLFAVTPRGGDELGPGTRSSSSSGGFRGGRGAILAAPCGQALVTEGDVLDCLDFRVDAASRAMLFRVVLRNTPWTVA